MIGKICVKDNNVVLEAKKGSLLSSPNKEHNVIRMEKDAEKLKKLLKQR